MRLSGQFQISREAGVSHSSLVQATVICMWLEGGMGIESCNINTAKLLTGSTHVNWAVVGKRIHREEEVTEN